MENDKEYSEEQEPSKPFFERIIYTVERIGNYLPHPFFLFIILIIVIVLLSALLSYLGVTVTHTGIEQSSDQAEIKTVSVINLLKKEILQSIMGDFVKTFAYFAPVGFVIIMILGVGLAEQAGLFTAVIRLLINKTPPVLITFVLAITGICANIASDAGIVIAPAIGGAVFLALRRHPIAGVCAGYVAAYGGYSANMFIAGTDVMLAGITQSAIGYFKIDALVHPLMNWYVMMGSTIMLALVVTLITVKIIVPYIGEYDPPEGLKHLSVDTSLELKPDEKKGLVYAIIAGFIFKKDYHDLFAEYQKIFRRYPGIAKYFLKEDGSCYVKGETFRQPALAKTLRTMANEGAGSFYKGKLAQAMFIGFSDEYLPDWQQISKELAARRVREIELTKALPVPIFPEKTVKHGEANHLTATDISH
jgi:p-aminobenzoyl-glutamate transporter AbgT